mgnify:CR=1 FL=1
MLRLTRAGDYVMDEKGELLFRRRQHTTTSSETITRARIAQHLLPDDIPQSLVRTNTLVVGPDLRHFPPRDRAFIEANYISVGPLRSRRTIPQPFDQQRFRPSESSHQLRDQDSCVVQHRRQLGIRPRLAR